MDSSVYLPTDTDKVFAYYPYEELMRDEVDGREVLKMWKDEEDSPWDKKTILSLDGGGIRGLSSLFILKELMSRIEVTEQNMDHSIRSSVDPPSLASSPPAIHSHGESRSSADPRSSFLPCHYFDYIGGTSTGGLIAIMLGRLRLPVDEAIEQYKRLSSDVYAKPSVLRRPLSPTSKKSALSRCIKAMPNPAFPSDNEENGKFASDTLRCKTVVCVLREREEDCINTPHLIRSYDYSPGWVIRDVVRATSAAPAYFKPLGIERDHYMDAGSLLNNPTLELYREVYQSLELPKDGVDVLLSLGSGYVRSKSRAHDLDNMKDGPTLTLEQRLKSSGRHIKVEDHIDDLMAKLARESSSLHYYRFCPELKIKVFDSWKATTYSTIEAETMVYLQETSMHTNLAHCAEMLVKRRQARARTIQWESFALGTRYRCTEKNCPWSKERAKENGNKSFETKNVFSDHLQIVHGYYPPKIQTLLEKGRTNS